VAWRSGSHAAAFEATVALDTVRGDKTLAYNTVSQTRARISITSISATAGDLTAPTAAKRLT
jgi:hypothetical protein